MAEKILTKNGIENTNIDGARSYYFSAGNRNGVVKGYLTEGSLTASGNAIIFGACELMIYGHRIVEDTAITKTLTSTPSIDTDYSLIARLVLTETVPSIEFVVQSTSIELIQNDLSNLKNGQYDLELGQFTLTTSGAITNIIKTVDVISGGVDNYNALENKPKINNIELINNKSLSDLGIATKTSQLTNDSGFITSTAVANEYVAKDGDKVLSDNNYTTPEKTKLAGLYNIATKQDLTETFTATINTLYQHTGSTNVQFVQNGLYWYSNNRFYGLVDIAETNLYAPTQTTPIDLDTITTTGEYTCLGYFSNGINNVTEYNNIILYQAFCLSIPNKLPKTQNIQFNAKQYQRTQTDNVWSDWVELAGGGSSGTSNYNDLSNKPKINNVELSDNKTLNDLGIQAKATNTTDTTSTTITLNAIANNNYFYGSLSSLTVTYPTGNIGDEINIFFSGIDNMTVSLGSNTNNLSTVFSAGKRYQLSAIKDNDLWWVVVAERSIA